MEEQVTNVWSQKQETLLEHFITELNELDEFRRYDQLVAVTVVRRPLVLSPGKNVYCMF